MGRESALAGLQAFIRKYEKGPDHPVLQDFVATMREFAPDKDAYDEFVKAWFFQVVVPEYPLSGATKTRVIDLSAGDDSTSDVWEVKVTVKNAGTGALPVEIAATRGERFPDEKPDGAKMKKAGKDLTESASGVVQAAGKGSSEKPYRAARATLHLGPGESQEAVIRCDFEPDALVLQLRRKLAVHRF